MERVIRINFSIRILIFILASSCDVNNVLPKFSGRCDLNHTLSRGNRGEKDPNYFAKYIISQKRDLGHPAEET
jgi:hypothetical protein